VAASLEYLEKSGVCELEDRTVAIEGFGRIGAPTARLLGSQGFRIVAISNLSGTLHDPGGLDVEELLSIHKCNPDDVLSRYRGAHQSVELLERAMLHHVNSTVLIPGARALTIDRDLAEDLKAKVICPISNAPLTTAGEEALVKRGVVSIPDIISNAGGIISSFAQHLGADRLETMTIVSEVITRNLEDVFSGLPSNEVPKRIAGQLALERLEEIRKSERIGSIKCLSPWLRRLGASAVLHGLREYFALKVYG